MEITLRRWTMADLKSLVYLADNPKIARNLTDAFPHPYKPVAGKFFLQMVTEPDLPNILAICLEGKVVGSIGLQPQKDIFSKNAELGYWLGEAYWGKGYMVKAVKQMIVYGFENWDYTRIFARPFGSNIASQRVLEKAGFTLESRIPQNLWKANQWEDELVYSVRRNT